MKRMAMAAGAASLVAVLALAACTNSGGGHAGSAASGGGKVARDNAGASAQVNAAASPAARPGVATNGGPDAAKGGKADPLLTSQALIRTADLSVEVARGASVPAQANRAEQLAISAGGLVFADDRTAGKAPTAALTLKVPGAALNGVLGQLSALGKEVGRQSTTRDVTTEVADVDSRVRSAQASINRLRVLFDRAVKVGEVIALESELAQRESDLESLQAQQRSLAAQTAMATVTLHLTTAAVAVVPPRKHKEATGGFLGGLHRGWDAFASAATGIAIGIGAVLPFLVLALLIGGAAVVVRRRTRSGAPPAAPPAEGSAA